MNTQARRYRGRCYHTGREIGSMDSSHQWGLDRRHAHDKYNR